MGIGKELLNTSISGLNVVDHRVDLDSIAGREQDSFLDTGIRTETSERLAKTAVGNRQPLTNFDRSRLMTQPNDDQMHESILGCLQRQGY